MEIGFFRKTGILALAVSVAAFCLPAAVLAQSSRITVSGKITDTDGEPLAGVSVMIPGTMTGVGSGLEGEYSITVDMGVTLRFSCIGFESKDIKVEKSRYDIVLERKP